MWPEEWSSVSPPVFLRGVCRWSCWLHRGGWYDDPPIGTIVLGHEQAIYLGNGEWRALADTPNY